MQGVEGMCVCGGGAGGGGGGGGGLCQDHIPKRLRKKYVLLTCCVQYLTSAFKLQYLSLIISTNNTI